MLVPRVAAIHDLSGIGRCSLTAAIPILASLGVQACPLPTAILSNQTGFLNYFFDDLTRQMQLIIDEWVQQQQDFSAIYSGFLGNEQQTEIISSLIKKCSRKDTLVVIDPVMGDNGAIYATYSHKMCKNIISLSKNADVITPNLTEACILADINYYDFIKEFSIESVLKLAEKISKFGPKTVIITGIQAPEEKIYNVAFNSHNKQYNYTQTNRINENYSGTGDIFASILCGCIVKGITLEDALNLATSFLEKVITETYQSHLNPKEGVVFEKYLYLLTERNK